MSAFLWPRRGSLSSGPCCRCPGMIPLGSRREGTSKRAAEKRQPTWDGGGPCLGSTQGTGAVSSGRSVLAQCRTLVASVGAACHSDLGDR